MEGEVNGTKFAFADGFDNSEIGEAWGMGEGRRFQGRRGCRRRLLLEAADKRADRKITSMSFPLLLSLLSVICIRRVNSLNSSL